MNEMSWSFRYKELTSHVTEKLSTKSILLASEYKIANLYAWCECMNVHT